MNINNYCRSKTIIPNHIFFAGGYPIFKIIPKLVTWGNILSIFWLGTELCIKIKK
jgi:hypothetical protein